MSLSIVKTWLFCLVCWSWYSSGEETVEDSCAAKDGSCVPNGNIEPNPNPTDSVASKSDTIIDGDIEWRKLVLNETETESINWHDYLSFHWNTPLLHASEDPTLTPMLQESVFKLIENNTFLSNIFAEYNKPSHFGNIYNLTQLLNDFSDKLDSSSLDTLTKLLLSYNQRIPQWMTLYTRNQANINHHSSNIFLLKLNPGDTLPIHGIHSFPIIKFDSNSINNTNYKQNHDLISIMALHPVGNDAHDGIHIFDPRGGVSGYGYASHELITTAQHQHMNFRGGNIVVFPSKLSFVMLPVIKYTRYYIVSFADIHTKMRHYVPKNQNENQASEQQQPTTQTDGISLDTLDIPSIYNAKNELPYWEQNIGLFSSYGTPIFKTSMNISNKTNESIDNNGNIAHSVSVPKINITKEDLETLKVCILHLSESVDTIHKSNRGKRAWQSKPFLFKAKFDSKLFKPTNVEKEECIKSISLIEDYIYEQLSLWVLSFRNSYYFDDNGIFIQIHTGNIIGIKIVHSWANVNYDDALNIPHLHTGSDLSGVFYVNVPECNPNDINNTICDGNEGSIMFKDPRTNLFDNLMRFSFGEFNEALKIVPQNGDVVLFPAWLHHWVMPSYNSTDPRISIAFNVDFVGYEMSDIVGDDDIVFVKQVN